MLYLFSNYSLTFHFELINPCSASVNKTQHFLHKCFTLKAFQQLKVHNPSISWQAFIFKYLQEVLTLVLTADLQQSQNVCELQKQ